MRIGIIGAGNIGSTAARLFAGAGHEVVVANSRGPETLEGLVREIGANARAGTVEEAADFGEVVMEAIPFGRYGDLPAEGLSGKVFVTASNYYPERDGGIDLGGRAQSEFLARHLPGARVVKAFNTIYYARLAQNGRPEAPLEERETIFVSGDDGEAKEIVSRLVEEIGFAPVDAGTLAQSARQEPGSPIYNVPMSPAEAREALAGMS
ncbi:NADP oxidoreductase [Rubrobacter marinus]|uniref:NADP oxidoreductase n=1 Tax=Rubrobacter marinus TaxID=2653852 RepID=A0A6G8PVC9_9ACTN|nr:NAD(P)-binding domain-containing protein [Rubrobacter marinus]QIN78158.1 NADP oxidoreductase [Rubrobacter marinus]